MLNKLDYKWIAAAALVLFAMSVHYLGHVYAPLTIAFVLAYLLEPVVARLDRVGFNRQFGVPLVLVLFFALLAATLLVVVPRIAAQGHELILRLPSVYSGVAQALSPLSEQYLGYDIFVDADKFVASLGDPTTLVKPIGGLVGGVFASTFRVVTAALGLLIIPLMAYYLLREFPHMWEKFLYVVPVRHHQRATEIRARLHEILGGFLRGQLVVSSVLSLYYCVAFALMRLELALVLGLMAGFFNIVPYLGITSVLVLTLLIAFIHGAGVATFVSVGIVFAVGMAIEGSFLTPRIVGRKVGLSPLMLIIALLVGGELSGLTGMLLAVPIAAIGKVFFGVFLEGYRTSEPFTRGSR